MPRNELRIMVDSNFLERQHLQTEVGQLLFHGSVKVLPVR